MSCNEIYSEQELFLHTKYSKATNKFSAVLYYSVHSMPRNRTLTVILTAIKYIFVNLSTFLFIYSFIKCATPGDRRKLQLVREIK